VGFLQELAFLLKLLEDFDFLGRDAIYSGERNISIQSTESNNTPRKIPEAKELCLLPAL
jgi:hypothetical protein